MAVFLSCGASNVDSKNDTDSIKNLKNKAKSNERVEKKRVDVGSFSIEIPVDWNLVEKDVPEKGYNFAVKGKCSNVFCTNLIGTQYDVDSAENFNSFTTDWFTEAQLSQFGVEYNSYMILKNEVFDIRLFEYYFVQNDVNILGLSYILDFKNNWWVLTFMSEYDDSRKSDFIKTTKGVIDSIKF